MSDGITDGYRASEDLMEEAKKKFGHLSDKELSETLKEGGVKLEAVRNAYRYARRNLDAVQHEYDLLQRLFYDRLQKGK